MTKPTNPQVGTKYRVIRVDETDVNHGIRLGDILTLVDGRTPYPIFKTKNGVGFAFSWNDLEPLEKTFETLEVGDVVLDGDMDEHTVLAVCGKIIALSNWDNQNEFGDWYTKEEFEEYNYSIKHPSEDVTELSMDAIAEKFNLPVEQIRIKKETI